MLKMGVFKIKNNYIQERQGLLDCYKINPSFNYPSPCPRKIKMKKVLTIYGYGKSKVESKVYSRTPKGCHKFDIIRLIVTHEDGHKFADFFVYPEEAMMISTALMRAWLVTFQQGMQNINPNNFKYYKPFMELKENKKNN